MSQKKNDQKKVSKKVRFSESEKDKKKADKKAESLLGGAIETSKTRFQDIESRKPLTINHHMQRAAMLPGAPHVASVGAHGLPNMIPRNDIAFTQYLHFFGRHSEDELYSNVSRLVTGKASTDHPHVQNLMHHSFGHMPEILAAYNRY